jgi:ribosome biogenesis GTPase
MVRRVGGGVYTVALGSGEIVEASLRGRLKLEQRTGDQVVIGDRVRVQALDDGAHVIEEVFPRETAITRSRFGGRTIKVLVANADRLLVVVAAAQPKPRRDLIDRLLVVGESGGVTPLLVVNKMDIDGATEVASGLEQVYQPLGYDVLRVSAVAVEGMDRLAEQLCHGIAALAGPSGVGKSSLVNALEPEHALRTGELSRKRGTGRHTTVSSSLIQLRCGGLVADTPGFSDVGVWGVPREELDNCFPELRALMGACRFRECSHLHEPDCAVRQALEEGTIDPGRFESYRTLYEESSA